MKFSHRFASSTVLSMGAAGLILSAAVPAGSYANARSGAAEVTSQSPIQPTTSTPVARDQRVWTIMAVGGSVARGWNAENRNGYLEQSMNQVSSSLGVQMQFDNESIGGFTPEKLTQRYPQLLKEYKPQIVVISWGLLDDIASKSPKSAFEASVTQEVYQAVQSKAEVWIVTPPATEASYAAKDAAIQEDYAGYEIQAARSVKGQIRVFDLLNDMKHWLKSHNGSIANYASNAWHPNTAGHTLAGQLLAEAIIARKASLPFGN